MDTISGITTSDSYVEDYYFYEVLVNGRLIPNCVFACKQIQLADGRKSSHGRAVAVDSDASGCLKCNRDNTGPELVEYDGEVIIRLSSKPVTERYSPEFCKVYGKHFKVARAVIAVAPSGPWPERYGAYFRDSGDYTCACTASCPQCCCRRYVEVFTTIISDNLVRSAVSAALEKEKPVRERPFWQRRKDAPRSKARKR